MDQLAEHMRSHMARVAPTQSEDNVFRLPHLSRLGDQGSEALDLVYQAADVIRANEGRAAETEARLLDMARNAAEKLENAVTLIGAAGEARRTSEARAHAAENAVIALDAKVQRSEEVLREMQVLVSTLQARLSDAVSRATTAEKRAIEATNALAIVKNAILTKLLGAKSNTSANLAASAGRSAA
jgi:hypothetical protein